MRIFDTYGSPTAKVADGRLILNLPDAETPALWMMDINDASTSVLRLETDRQGLFVIKKHGHKGTAETVAVYRDRSAALYALEKASAAMEKARTSRANTYNGRPIVVRPVSRAMRFFNILLVVWFVLYLTGIDRLLMERIYISLIPDESMAAAGLNPDGTPASTDAEATSHADPFAPPKTTGAKPQAGVPLSADDYLKSLDLGK